MNVALYVIPVGFAVHILSMGILGSSKICKIFSEEYFEGGHS